MSKSVKFIIGLAAALLAGVIAHGPLGRGEAFVEQLDAILQSRLPEMNVPNLSGSIQREPLARTAILSGPTTCFQRYGLDTIPGIDARLRAIPGMGRVEWANPPEEGECR